MAYDRSRVEFTDEEHEMAAALDIVVEAVYDGLDMTDLLAVPAATKVLTYLGADGLRGETVSRLIALAVMLERDNDYLGDIG